MLVITDVKHGADFSVYAPTGSTWTKNGSVYSSTLNGKNYWSMAFIPLTASNVAAVAQEGRFAKVNFQLIPTGTCQVNTNVYLVVLCWLFILPASLKSPTESRRSSVGALKHQTCQ